MSVNATSGASRLLIFLCALGVAGCGDAILCGSSPLVVIQSPTSAIAVDGDAAATGVQADVRVRSTLLPTDELELIVLDGSGAEMASIRKAAGDAGSTLFEGVTVPGPRATLRAVGRGECGVSEDEVALDVVVGSGCELQISPSPQSIPAYPVGVLNASLDQDPAPGFQAQVAVASRDGWTVELFSTTGVGEQRVGQGMTDTMGMARFPQTLPDGPVSLRAVCRGPGGEVLPSVAVSAHVDTTPPSCDFTSPLPGTSITPALDQDGDLGNGVQLELTAQIGRGDAEGESVQLAISSPSGMQTVPLSPVDAFGQSKSTVTLAPSTTPTTFNLTLSSRDRAGNPCTNAALYDVIYNGCSIDVLGPTGPVTADADNLASNGSQIDVQLAVAPLCAGRTVTSTCGTNSPSGVVPANGMLTLRATLCGSSPCELQSMCTFRVTSPAGVQTQAPASFTFDDQGPAVSVQLVQPLLACNAQITATADVDPVAAGVQIMARVTAVNGLSPELDLTNVNGTTTTPASGDVKLTVAPGLNVLTGVALDALNNRGQSPSCAVSLSDFLTVGFGAPAADGLLGRPDGTVSGTTLTFPLCGTVNRADATVAVRVDGGAAMPATVNGTSWCVTLALAEGSHAVSVTATKGTSSGSKSLPLVVDLTPPDPVTAFSGTAPTRQQVRLAWTAPGDGEGPAARYVVKSSTSQLTEDLFETQGTVIPTGPPKAPGSPEAADLFPARTGAPYWLGVAPIDAAGNRAPAAIVGPITPAFDQIGPVLGPDLGLGSLAMGAAIAHGKFNNDEFDDLAVAAPTQNAGGLTLAGAVYVYFGGPGGISTTPSLAILGGAANSLAGSGLAAVRWTSPVRDDLVIGAPGADGGAGRLYVLSGGAGFPTGTITASAAPLQIGVNAAAPGWFANAGLGASAVAADVDGDGLRDLVASAIRGGGTGGIVIVYGGTVTSSISLSDTSPSLGGAVVEYLRDPLDLANHRLGSYLHAVGPTRGPLDTDDDLVVGYEDDVGSAGDSVYLLRGNGTRPAAGLTQRSFVPGRDVRIDLVTTYRNAEWGAQAISSDDLNGDGASDLVISAYRNLNGAGQVLVIDGDTIGNVGAGGVARTTDAGVVLTTISGASGMRLGAALVARDELSVDDVDGDGLRDLMVGGVSSGAARLFVWFGGTLPLGTTTVATAGTTIAGPSVFQLSAARPSGAASQARWVGDLNGDGLDDVCWSSPYDNSTSLDGAFAVLLDGLP